MVPEISDVPPEAPTTAVVVAAPSKEVLDVAWQQYEQWILDRFAKVK